MKGISFSRFLGLFMVMFAMFSMSVFANNKDYYSKTTVKAVGEGKVYVKYKAAAEAPEYATESEAVSEKDSQSEAPKHSYFLYAQANEGSKFAGWFDNEECTGSAISGSAEYEVSFTVTSNTADEPTTMNFFAKFVDSSAPLLACNIPHVYLNIDAAPVANDGLIIENITPAFESSNTDVVTVDAEGKLTPVGAGSSTITVSGEGQSVSYVATVVNNLTAGVTQIGNGDFEDWRSASDSNHAPDNWNSFETNEGSLASLARAQQVQLVEGARPGSNGFYCVDIYSRSVMGVVAQGNLTTGCINAGATSAAAKDNYNYSKTSDPSKSETLSKIPTAIRFWAKFVPAAENAQHPNAHVEAVVHDNFDYITYSQPSFESDEEKSHVVARVRKDFPTTNGEWVEFTVPFDKTANAVNGQLYIIVNLATNADPGQGQAGDHLYIDDIELLYETEYAQAPVAMTDAKYATFCAPFEVNVPFGMKAYTVDGVKDDASLDMKEVEGVIPANTPVILEGNSVTSLTAYGVAEPATAQAGLLTGVYEETVAPVGSYVLQNLEGAVGMYKVTEGTQPKVEPNHAYLTVPASNVRAYFFSSESATAIENVNVKDNDNKGAIYNIAGQRISRMQKGINIINGKKVAVK